MDMYIVLGLRQKKVGLGFKSTDLRTSKETNTPISCSSMYVRMVRSRSLVYFDKLSIAERGKGSGNYIRRWFLGHGPSLWFSCPRSCPLDSKLRQLFVVYLDRDYGTFDSPSPCKPNRLTTSPFTKYGYARRDIGSARFPRVSRL